VKRLKISVHDEAAGIMYMAYVPAGRSRPSIFTGVEKLIVVFSFAPARQTTPYGTCPSQIFRLFTAGW
jgi:hypothetical protein